MSAIKVIKRDGTIVDYDRSKIKLAIQKANAAVEPEFRVSQRMCIVSKMTIISRFCCFRHTRRYIKIGFTNFQMNNINTLFL